MMLSSFVQGSQAQATLYCSFIPYFKENTEFQRGQVISTKPYNMLMVNPDYKFANIFLQIIPLLVQMYNYITINECV